MRVLLQRVSRAEVRIREGDNTRVSGTIGRGFVVLVGFTATDTEAHVEWCLDRYRSYNPATNTYTGYDGLQHICRGPY